MLGDLIQAAKLLGEWFEKIRTAVKKNELRVDAAHDEAITRIDAACLATIAHLGRLEEGAVHRTNAELMDMWMHADGALRGINAPLAEACRLKAMYWADPQGWAEPERVTARIELGRLNAAALRLRRACNKKTPTKK